MTDQLPYCIHCGAQQINADARFCYRCGQPIVPAATPARRQRPPWVGPVLVSTVIVAAAAIVFARLLSGGPAANKTAAATSAPPADAGTMTPATIAQSLGDQVTPPRAEIAPTREPPTPPSTETLQPTPTLANVTPGPLRLTRLAWSTNGKLLAVGSGTGVYLYDAATWQEIRFIPLQVSVPSSLGDGPDQLAFSFDGALLATLDRIVQVWRVVDGSLAYELKASGFLGASPAEGLWATFGEEGSTSGNLRLWRTSDGQLVRTIATNLNFPFSLAFSSDGRLIAAGPMEGGAPGVWQVADGRRVAQLNWEMADIFGWADLAFRPNTTMIAAVGGLPEAVLVLWDANTGTMIRQLVALDELPQGPTLNGVSYTPDGSLLAGSFWGNTGQQSKVQLWSADGARGRSWALPGKPNDMAFGPDGKLLAVLTEKSVYLYNPSDGSVARQLDPVWRQGILPTPTPTPLALGLNLPADWREYYDLGGSEEFHFRIRIPTNWVQTVAGVSAFDVAPSTDPLTPKTVQIHRGNCGSTQNDPGNQSSLDLLKRVWASNSEVESIFVTGGEWPLIIPATYAEFDRNYNLQNPKISSAVAHRKTRLIVLDWRFEEGMWGCVLAWLEDELEDISEQDRLDFSRVVASIQAEDRDHPFPTATPTFTPTPNPAPRPALPLQILFDAKTSRSASGGGAEITININDAYGKPVDGPEVTLVLQGWRINLGVGSGGRYETSFGGDTLYQRATVEVYWNQELIAQQDFALSWQ